jgi:hypothetical protein
MHEWQDAFCDLKLDDSSMDTWHTYTEFFTPEEQVLLKLPKTPPQSPSVPQVLTGVHIGAYAVELLLKAEENRPLRDEFGQYCRVWLDGLRSRFRRACRSVNDVMLDVKCLDELPDVFQVSTAVYPYWSKFTPSCDPDVVEINCAEYLVVRARRPLKKGKAITRSSGSSFLDCTLDERREAILEKRGSQCNCRPCKENWPTESVLQTQAENREFKVNCPNCRSCLGMYCKALGLGVDKNAVCGKNGCTEKRADIKNRITCLVDRLEAAKKRKNFCQPFQGVEKEAEELKNAFEMVTEARLLMEQPCIHIVDCERYADVLFLRMGNARHDSQKEWRETRATKQYVSPNDLVHGQD